MDTVTIILLDFSGSMKGKMRSVKDILLKEVFPTMNYSSRIGLFLFRTNGNSTDVVEEQLSLNVTSQQTLAEKVNALGEPKGGTPIAAAIKKAVNTLKEFRALAKRIILVTDGQETGGGNYIAEAKAARADGIECEIHIIGLSLNDEAATQAREIAAVSSGSFSNIQSGSYTPSSNAFDGFKTAIQKSRERVKTQALSTVPSVGAVNTVEKASEKIIDSDPIKEEAQKTAYGQLPTTDTEQDIDVEEPENDKTTEILTTENKNDMNTTEINPQNEDTDMGKKKTKAAIEQLEKRVESLEASIREQIEQNKELTLALKALTDKLVDQKMLDENLEGDVIINENEEHNQKVGRKAEELVFDRLKELYGDRVTWNNENQESNLNHDYVVGQGDQGKIYFECKGTSSDENTFFLTRSEWELFLSNQFYYQVFFVKNVLSDKPEIIHIRNLMDWINKGKIVPYSNRNRKVKAERVMLTFLD
ncbi:VWA domain-containing protein [Phaeodactylibacter xiamenensis]|uniref:VWA domain-containing protein n=1 Tax=Phaeodactylibacter xiamenensis TaxID=1524460 RepID=UPI0024A9259E|nr:VWA domain-containing protein [Phaeodactylibacter xiamenensis]